MMMPSIFGENLFNDWMDFSFPDVDRKLYGKHVDRIMKTDVREKEDAYEVMIDLPGFKKEEVKIELKNGNLTIHAAKTLDKEEKKEGKYIRQERYSGNMSRSFYVGENVKVQDVQAKFENGILTLDIPKKDPKKPVEENHYVTIM
ncbi:MAG: Hsp20/alpha crystallin family protein [Blautia sp.]|nr:Hsp20/alpha crystallin family protein [Blautia sp.]MDD7370211.1 Hsp20/alpha crystallin family protein [Bacillota bacterium]MDY3714276.1 Hsp20/alpha crystallin family protein [Blautia sp.]